MSFVITITTYSNDSAKDKAKLANDRRKQAQNWLRRQAEGKKSGAPHRPVTQTPDGSHAAAAGSGSQSFGRRK
jgi:hypothetical protein